MQGFIIGHTLTVLVCLFTRSIVRSLAALLVYMVGAWEAKLCTIIDYGCVWLSGLLLATQACLVACSTPLGLDT